MSERHDTLAASTCRAEPGLWQLLEEMAEPGAESEETLLRRAEMESPELGTKLRGLVAARRASESYFAQFEAELRQRASAELEARQYLGRRIGPYEVCGHLGTGGMGSVFLTRPVEGGRGDRVAIKVMHSGFADQELFERFLEEGRILASLSHPHIARFFDSGINEDGLPYFAMEYVRGRTLDDFVRLGAPSLEQRIELFLGICAAVHHLHENSIVHRDLKPGNVMVDRGGKPVLIDFGIARALDGSADPMRIAWTPAYATPEQLEGAPITKATDVYALGVLLFELVSERRFLPPGLAAEEVVEAIVRRPAPAPSELRPRRPGGSRDWLCDLDRICRKALEKAPDDRYPSAESLSSDVRRCMPALSRDQNRGLVREDLRRS